MPRARQEHTRSMPGACTHACQEHAQRHVKCSLRTCWMHARSMHTSTPGADQEQARSMPRARQKHAHLSMPGATQERARRIPDAHQQHATSKPGARTQACQEYTQRHAKCVSGACWKHARSKPETRQGHADKHARGLPEAHQEHAS